MGDPVCRASGAALPNPNTEKGASVPSGLSQSIGLPQATAIVAGIIIGASIFVQPSEVTRLVTSLPGILGVWLVAGILTLCGALVCAELASAFPKTGGVYVFLKEGISPAAGFLWGWAMFWSVHSGIAAAIAVVFARYVGFFFPLDDNGIRLVAMGGIAILSLINWIGIALGAGVQAWLTFAKVLAIGVILIVAAALGSGEEAGPTSSGGESLTASAFILAISAGLFSFGGWHMVTYSAGETRDPSRTIPRALIFGTLIVTACYLGLNTVYLTTLPLERVVASTRVAADAAEVLIGPTGAAAISVLVVVSALGSLNGVILSGPRLYFAMARDGMLFRWAGAVDARFRTPHWAILLQAVWSCLLVATGTYRALFTRVIYTEWIFFALMTVGLMRLRRRSDYRPSAPAPGYPIVPVLFILASATIVMNQILTDWVESAIGLAFVAVGLPVYFLAVRGRVQKHASD
jgi:APA family basic amino acid/polyamine antiporter